MEVTTMNLSEINELLKDDNLLEFNRDITPKHVEKMQQSILNCGILRLPVIADISKFDKTNKSTH